MGEPDDRPEMNRSEMNRSEMNRSEMNRPEMNRPEVNRADWEAVAAQLGRPPRALRSVAHRCGCGLPSVVRTHPRLADGTPFPTLYYLTCTRLTGLVSRIEAGGAMREMTDRLARDPELARAYRAAHESYLARRDAAAPLGTRVSAGGMPDRVKCLHVHVAHALAVGPGVNPFGDEVLTHIGPWWSPGPCVARCGGGDGQGGRD